MTKSFSGLTFKDKLKKFESFKDKTKSARSPRKEVKKKQVRA